ncbi:2EXR family [Microdochium nivale]|nr:2EXR family [Microdochium nivale]
MKNSQPILILSERPLGGLVSALAQMSSFNAFPLLPAELRELIWLQALSASLFLDDNEPQGDSRLRLPTSSDLWSRHEQSCAPRSAPGKKKRLTRPAIFSWVPGLLLPRRILPGEPEYLDTTGQQHQGDGDEDDIRHNLLLEFRHDLLDDAHLGAASLALLWVCREARRVVMRSRMLGEEAGVLRRQARCERGYRRWDDCCRAGNDHSDGAASCEDEALADAELPNGQWQWESTFAGGDEDDNATSWCFNRTAGDNDDERIINTRARWFQRAELQRRPERECCIQHRHCPKHDADDDNDASGGTPRPRPVVYTRPFDLDADALLLSAYTWPLFLGEPYFRLFAPDLTGRNIQMPGGTDAPRRLAVTEQFLRQLVSHGELGWLFSEGSYPMLEALWVIVNADDAVREERAGREQARHGSGGCEWRRRPRWEVENTLIPRTSATPPLQSTDGDTTVNSEQMVGLVAHLGYRRLLLPQGPQGPPQPTLDEGNTAIEEEHEENLVSPFSQLAHDLGLPRDLAEESRLMDMVRMGFEIRLVRIVRA